MLLQSFITGLVKIYYYLNQDTTVITIEIAVTTVDAKPIIFAEFGLCTFLLLTFFTKITSYSLGVWFFWFPHPHYRSR